MAKDFKALAEDMVDDLTRRYMLYPSRIRGEEFNLYFKHYYELAEEIKQIESVKINEDTPEAIEVGDSRVSAKDFDKPLWMEIQLLAAKWKAYPITMVFALILVSRYLETMVQILESENKREDQINKGVKSVEQIYALQKERDDNNDWDYR